jgi:hypothetical protein
VVAFFVAAFVAFTTASGRSDWYGIAAGCGLGLFFGVVFAFGGESADLLDGT